MRCSALKRITRCTLAALLAALISCAPFEPFIGSALCETSTIRVGYTDANQLYPGESGGYSGYIADYLDELSSFTGWNFEYVYCPRNEWADMLFAGEVDMFGLVHSNENSKYRFSYSHLPVTYDYAILYTREDNDICYQEYDAMGFCSVGVLSHSIYPAMFIEYAKETGLTFSIRTYSGEQELLRGLDSGEVDYIVTSSFNHLDQLNMLDCFKPNPVYFVTDPGNIALMRELDAAMEHFHIASPETAALLDHTYIHTGSALHLTREELAYIDSAGVIDVRTCAGQRPLTYPEGDRIAGLLPDYLDLLGQKAGLEFRYILDNQELPADSLEDTLDRTGSVYLAVSDADARMLHCTDSLLDLSLTYVTAIDSDKALDQSSIFAIPNDMSKVGDMITADGYIVEHYPTIEDCLRAVADGSADATMHYKPVISGLLDRPAFAAHLTETVGLNYSDKVVLYAPNQHELLVSILDKALACVTDEEYVSFVTNSMLRHAYDTDMEDMFYKYDTAIFIAASMIVIVILMLILYRRAAHARQQAAENEALQKRLWTDPLTSLHSREGFFEFTRRLLDTAEGGASIIRVNISRFKLVNDLYGSEKGDRLLTEVGKLLCSLTDYSDRAVIGRFSADHFYICLENYALSMTDLPRLISPYWLDMDVYLTYGIYPIEDDLGLPLNIMCDRANMASALAHPTEHDYVRYYSDEERQRLLRQQEIEKDMERALEEGQFQLYIQPKYDIETDLIVGGESLVRWQHPEKGLISPAQFIPIFEGNGFIRKLDYYIWEKSCRFLHNAKRMGVKPLPLSVNVSRTHFYGEESMAVLNDLVRRYELTESDIELEITESFYSEDSDAITAKCQKLRSMGYRIAMDDFGSGYSSLNMLKEVPIDIIKMDLRFLSSDAATGDESDKGRSILKTLIELSHALHLRVVVEGLETRSQLDFLRSIGNCAAQGFYFFRPIPEERYLELISGDSCARPHEQG